MELVPDIVKTNEQRAPGISGGTSSGKEALRLLDAGNVTIWGATEAVQARMVLATDLVNADATLADQDLLLRALRVRTY